MSAPLLLLTGAPRSGTKLLRHMLDRHPRIALTTNETEFLPYLMAFTKRADLTDPSAFARFVRYLSLEDYVFYRRLDRHDPPDFAAWQAAIRRDGAHGAFERFLRQELGADDPAIIVGDKSPGYARHLPAILDALPNARAVHIVRDPRAQAGSLRRVFGKTVVVAARRWQAAVAAAQAAHAAFPDRIIEVRYEDLTADPVAVLTRLCAFTGVEFAPAMLRVDTALERYRPAAGQQGLRAPDPQAFRDDLTQAEIARVEAICDRGMARHGYRPVASGQAVRTLSCPAGVQRVVGALALAGLTWRRHGMTEIVRKVRLAHARRRILAGTW